MFRCIATFSLLGCLVGIWDSAAIASASKASTKEVMQTVFEPISRILALSFDKDKFADPKNQPAIRQDILTMTRNISTLAEHAKSQDRAFEYVAKSLVRDAHQVERRYMLGRYDEAAFTLHHMIENCIACHANLPETQKFPKADTFFEKVAVEKMSLLDLAQLQIIGRRFDAALASYETFFKSKESDLWLITSLGSFADYLKVCISVKSDFKRPQVMIEQLIAKPQTPTHIKAQLTKWLGALKDMDKREVLKKIDVASARQVLDEGRAMMEFQRDRDGLIQFLTAEAMLSRYVRGRSDNSKDLAEAYYLLGTAAALTEHSFWLVRGDFFLETAIRMAPGAAFAPKAYGLLEESLTFGYSGSGGTDLPYDVVVLLDDLKRLIAQNHK